MTKLKEEYPWLKQVNSQSIQSQLINLDNAYSRFFNKVANFPKHKKKSNKGSFQIPQHFEVDQTEGFLLLPKFKNGIKYDNHRKITGNIRNCTIIRSSVNKYFVSFLVDDTSIISFPKTSKQIGIDLGLIDFIATSEGEKVKCPHYMRKKEKALARSQRVMSRRKKGSNNRNKARLKIAKLHEHVANQRKDFAHKLSTRLVKENDVIYIETLKSTNMIKNKKLAKSIGDASWYQFITMLGYKCNWYEKRLVQIDQWEKTTGVCDCGYKTKLNLDVRTWTCPQCGREYDRDIQSAKVIKQIGRGTGQINDCGDCTSVSSTLVLDVSMVIEAVTDQGTNDESHASVTGKTSSFRMR